MTYKDHPEHQRKCLTLGNQLSINHFVYGNFFQICDKLFYIKFWLFGIFYCLLYVMGFSHCLRPYGDLYSCWLLFHLDSCEEGSHWPSHHLFVFVIKDCFKWRKFYIFVSTVHFKRSSQIRHRYLKHRSRPSFLSITSRVKIVSFMLTVMIDIWFGVNCYKYDLLVPLK